MYDHVREVLRNRARVNTPKVNRIREILEEGYDVIHKIVYSFTDIKTVQRVEIEEIRKHGRVDQGTGILLNLKTGDEKPQRREKRVCQYNRFHELIHTYSSTKEAATALNIKHVSSLSNAVKGRIPSYKGYLWTYEGEEIKPLIKVVPVFQWTKEGALVNRYKNAFETAKAVTCAPAQINQHISKNKGTVKGYIFSRRNVFPGYNIKRCRKR